LDESETDVALIPGETIAGNAKRNLNVQTIETKGVEQKEPPP